MFNYLKQQFSTRRRTDEGRPVPMIWVGNKEQATLINPDTGRLYAYVWHDGFGKFYPTVIVSPWQALHLIRSEDAMLASLLSFPRITVELYRAKGNSILYAQEYVEHYLGIRTLF